jgi:Holliday junction DNA helicase RuvA
MICHLKGILEEVGEDWVVVDVQGVGYQLLASKNTITQLPEQGQKVTLFVETVVRNEVQTVCCFISKKEKDFFKILIEVQGVGAKVALSILSCLSLKELSDAILNQDCLAIKKTHGVGGKIAERIVLELKNKKYLKFLENFLSDDEGYNQSSLSEGFAKNDLTSALLNFGYSRSDIIKVLDDVRQNQQIQTFEEKIRFCLQRLSQRLN